MKIFGYVLIKEELIDRYERAHQTEQKVIEARRWFCGWKDLDVIFDYILKEPYFGHIENTRKVYAQLRNTTEYGEDIK